MSAETFLNGKAMLCCGDSLHFLKDQPANRYDSIVTDPPYALVSITKRFGANGSAPVKVPEGGTGAYARASAGFMGKKWDTGETAFAIEFWQECIRVLKPGGHVAAFGGTRTYHRLACAIEDAGFEIRDQIGWCFGSGFPKSHDVSKSIDRSGGAQVGWFGPWLRIHREKVGLSQKELAERGGFYKNVNHGGLVANWELGYGIPTAKQFNKVCGLLNLPFRPIEEVEREIIGQRRVNSGVAFTSEGSTHVDITRPATVAASEWEGWGTALKPAWEPICLARKPLIGTVAENVLQHRTGAINVDECRVGDTVETWPTSRSFQAGIGKGYTEGLAAGKTQPTGSAPSGRWPANIIHDGSDEVIAAFPKSGPPCGSAKKSESQGWIAGSPISQPGSNAAYVGDTGSAARFFYTAKADSDDRLGSKHPTVKPVDLMQWLIRLITPKGGLVLDPFAGTGTTAEACFREGMRCAMIEREPEYQADIRRRMSLVLGGPEERKRESIKAKTKNDPINHGPLFSLLAD